jgi:hypothetical protein
MSEIKVGCEVVRVRSGKAVDSSKGTVKLVDKGWAQVYWHSPAHANTKPKHTKVAFQFLQVTTDTAPVSLPTPAEAAATTASLDHSAEYLGPQTAAPAVEEAIEIPKTTKQETAVTATATKPAKSKATKPQTVSKPVPAVVEGKAKLTSKELVVLGLLAKAPNGLTRGQLATSTGMAKGWSKLLGAATKGADRGLINKGLVKAELNKEEGREIKYLITPAGRKAAGTK